MPTSTPNDDPAREPAALIVVDHGSRRDEAGDTLAAVVDAIAARTPERYAAVLGAHMEIEAPSIADAVALAVAAGARHVVVAPLFLAAGRHATFDVPEQARAAVATHPGVTLAVAAAIGSHAGVVAALLDRIDEAEPVRLTGSGAT